jgi:hypothetical protein
MTVEARPIAAAGPGPQPEALRLAYLDLLKLTLCDLAGATTREVRWTDDKRWFSRELTGDAQLAGRAEGKDFSLDGLTMVGLRRLDALQANVESVVEDQIEGDLIEAGVWRGGASIFIRATLDSLGASERTLWLADSFEGFPPPDRADLEADRILETDFEGVDFLAPGLGTVQSYFSRFGLERGVRFVPGFFEHTLQHFRGKRWALIRIDADTYKATRLALDALYPGLSAGGYIVLDDYFHPWLPQCRKAVDDFRDEHRIAERVEQVDWNGGYWRRASEPPQAEPPAGLGQIVASTQAERRPPPRVPTDRELQLSDELAQSRARIAELEARVARLTASPRAAIRAWIGRGPR